MLCYSKKQPGSICVEGVLCCHLMKPYIITEFTKTPRSSSFENRISSGSCITFIHWRSHVFVSPVLKRNTFYTLSITGWLACFCPSAVGEAVVIVFMSVCRHCNFPNYLIEQLKQKNTKKWLAWDECSMRKKSNHNIVCLKSLPATACTIIKVSVRGA